MLQAAGDTVSGLFAPTEFEATLDAVFLIKRSGSALAAWTRAPAPLDVVSVMAATMWGSLDTMLCTLGSRAPRSALLEIEDRRILMQLVEPNWALLLVAPATVDKRRLSHVAHQILDRISATREHAPLRNPVARVGR